MSKKQQTTTQSQNYTNTYGYMQTPINAQMQSVIDMANAPVRADPSTQHRYAAIEQDVKNSYADPYGAYTTPDVREKSLRSNLSKLGVERDKAMREDYHQAEGASFARKSAAAAMTAPQLVSTGGNSQGQSHTVQQGGFWMSVLPSIISGASTMGAAA